MVATASEPASIWSWAHAAVVNSEHRKDGGVSELIKDQGAMLETWVCHGLDVVPVLRWYSSMGAILLAGHWEAE